MFSKLLIYGGPGTGKSVFAYQFPKAFFLNSDGNYEFLKIFGAKEEDHKVLTNWSDTKKVIQDIYSTNKYDAYNTIVVDLLEDFWKWCETEWLEKNKIEHPSEMGFGKAYDITRNKFFIEIGKLLSVPKNIILISHQKVIVHKTKKGTEWFTYAPSDKLPDKLLDSIEGRLTGVLRCDIDTTVDENTGKQTKVRYLNLIPQDDEFGIIRGVDEDEVPHRIPLTYKAYQKVMDSQQEKIAKKFFEMLENDSDVIEVKAKLKEKAEKVVEEQENNDAEENEAKEETQPVAKRRRKTTSVEISKEEDINKEEFDVSNIDEEKSVEVIEEIKEKTNDEKKADILEKLKRMKQEQAEEQTEENEVKEETETTKESLLKKLRQARKATTETPVETKQEEVEVVEEKKIETREEKLARLRKMRG